MIDTPIRRETFHSASKLTAKAALLSKSSEESSDDKTPSTSVGESRTTVCNESGNFSSLRPYAEAIGVRFSAREGNAAYSRALS
jgi:hypothetical protein